MLGKFSTHVVRPQFLIISLNIVYVHVGTHDIKTAEILRSTINITYFTGSNATGALLSQVCITDTTSIFQTVHRSLHPIPYNLMALTCSGQVQLLLYDIEGSGTLPRGGNYPAVKQRVAGNRQGSYTNIGEGTCFRLGVSMKLFCMGHTH